MPYPVVIYSADKIRGGILKKILQRNEIKTLLVNKIIEMRDSISKFAPDIVIIDTKNSLKDEINFLKNLSYKKEEIFVFFLGSESVISTFERMDMNKNLHLADPLNPEFIVSKVKKILLSKAKDKKQKKEDLESSLKQFLKLE